MLNDINNRQVTIDLDKYNSVVVVGVGGIGSWVALNMALTGKTTDLILIDDDKIESSNLNRTPFRMCDVGSYKVDALKYLILERRVINIETFREKTNPELISEIMKIMDSYHANRNVIIDCRDDIFTDMYELPCDKYYKVGYDGLGITIDGDPKNTPVWGRADGYRTVPSFICPAQFVANLVVSDIVVSKTHEVDILEDEITDYPIDEKGRLNGVITIDTKDLLQDLYEICSQRGDVDDSS